MTSKNTLTKYHIAVAQNASGRELNVPVYHFRGPKPGPKVYIQSSIHGAEVQGNVVIYHLIKALSEYNICGEIILVPNCNPVGTNIKAGEYTMGRFDPVNGTNWNRGYYYQQSDIEGFLSNADRDWSTRQIKASFKQFRKQKIELQLANEWGLGLTQQLNLKLQLLSVDADIVLDLHNGPVACRHLYVPEYARHSAQFFNIPHIISIPNQFDGALDEASFCPWWTLSECLWQRNGVKHDFAVEAFTLEMGSQEIIDFDEGHYDAQSIMSYLSHSQVFKNKTFIPDDIARYWVNLQDYKVLYTRQGGMVQYLVTPGQQVKKDQVMARVLNIDELDTENAVEEIFAPCDLIVILHFPSASVLSGTQLFKCFTNYALLSSGSRST